MILTQREYRARRRHGRLFDRDDAQTIASWWYHPGAPALVYLATRNLVVADLAEAAEREQYGAHGDDLIDLVRLAEWARAQDVDPIP